MQIDSLDAKQLKKIISEASEALIRRQRLEKAIADIKRVSRKHNLNRNELLAITNALQPAKAPAKAKLRKPRKQVKPKYQSIDGTNKWTGRGRSPAWVVELCKKNKISIEQFNSDPRFRT